METVDVGKYVKNFHDKFFFEKSKERKFYIKDDYIFASDESENNFANKILSKNQYLNLLLREFFYKLDNDEIYDFYSPKRSIKNIYFTSVLYIFFCFAFLLCFSILYFKIFINSFVFLTLFLCLLQISFYFFLVLFSQKKQSTNDEKQYHHDDNSFSILVPLYKEEKAAKYILTHFSYFKYNRKLHEFIFLCEEDDKKTINILSNNIKKFPEINCQLLILPNAKIKTKPRALNIGLLFANNDIICVYDAEDRPENDQLAKASKEFNQCKDKTKICFQAILSYYNKNIGWLTSMFSLEYDLLFKKILFGNSNLRLFFPFGGTSNFFHKKLLFKSKGWDKYNVTEDADCSINLRYIDVELKMLDSITYEEAVDKIMPWISQRTRWLKGYFQCYLMYLFSQYDNNPNFQNKRFINLFDNFTIHIFIGMKFFLALSFPIAFVVFAVTFFTDYLENTFIYFDLFYILLGVYLFLYVLLYFISGRRSNYKNFILLLASSPIYGILSFIPAWIALVQYIVNPFYWDKTTHFSQQISFEKSKIYENNS